MSKLIISSLIASICLAIVLLCFSLRPRSVRLVYVERPPATDYSKMRIEDVWDAPIKFSKYYWSDGTVSWIDDEGNYRHERLDKVVGR